MTDTSLAPVDAPFEMRPVARWRDRHQQVPELRDALHRLLAGRPVHYPVRPEVLASWRRETSPTFRFALKAPQRITHQLRLRDATEITQRFVGLAAFCLATFCLLFTAGR